MKVNFVFYMYIFSLMCRIINSCWWLVVWNAGGIYAYFVGEAKIIFSYNFRAALMKQLTDMCI